jgi:predicted MFS family arabinose efflux permease
MPQSLDWTGGLLTTAALGALTWALTAWSSHHSSSTAIGFALVVGTVLAITFVVVEHRRGERAMMPLTLFASTPFIGLTLLTLLLYGALGGLMVLVPYLLIVGGGYSPTHAGLALLPLSIVMGTMSGVAGRLAERIGPRTMLTLGPLVTAVGFALLTRANPQTSYWSTMLVGIVVLAIGMTATVAPLTTAVLAAVDARHTGTASGFNSAVARTGGLIATALSGAVMSQHGAELIGAFRHSAWIACALAAAAGGCAFLMLKTKPPQSQPQ